MLDPEFSVADALAAGATRDRLRRGDVSSHFHGARTRVVVDTSAPDARLTALRALCREYLTVAPAGSGFSHVTAARLWGMPLPWRLERDPRIHVLSARESPQPRGKSVVGHRAQAEFVSLRALPVVPSERAWIQLGAMLTVDELVIAGDYLVKRKRPLSSVAALQETVARCGRSRGAVAARAAVRDIRSGTDSPKESQLRLLIVRAGLPAPVIGHTVHDADGSFVGTPDLAYVTERVGIEYEGDAHRTDRQTFRDDIERRELFESAGWRIIRVTDAHFEHPTLLIARIRRVLVERAAR
jgi:hypothetical protein